MERLTDMDTYCAVVECDLAGCIIENCYDKKLYDKLQTYEDAEEQGLLIKLPCKVGDKVWCIDWYWDCGYVPGKCPDPSFNCDAYRCDFDKKKFVVMMREFDLGMLEQFGKTVFLTREEAERALERGSE